MSIAGGRHAMGGQQFGEANVLLDMRGLNRVLGFDIERGVIDVEGGIEWPQIIGHLNEVQASAEPAIVNGASIRSRPAPIA